MWGKSGRAILAVVIVALAVAVAAALPDKIECPRGTRLVEPHGSGEQGVCTTENPAAPGAIPEDQRLPGINVAVPTRDDRTGLRIAVVAGGFVIGGLVLLLPRRRRVETTNG